jgi:hypothetical protein
MEQASRAKNERGENDDLAEPLVGFLQRLQMFRES